jgi:hypothetical protein
MFLVFTSMLARADSGRSETKESLRGLAGVYVMTQVIQVQVPGFSTNDLDHMVKSELLNTGITVDPSPKKSNGNATINVTLATLLQPQLNIYIYTVEVSVTQDVQLPRQSHLQGLSAQTWRRTTQGITSAEHTDSILMALKQGVDAFAKDYHSVNH